MGMYTELIFGARLKSDTPKDVIDTLRYMVGDIEKPETISIELNRNPLRGGSYYFAVHQSVTRMWFDDIANSWTLSSRANIKNYSNEIEQFLEWIKPFIESGSGYNDMYAIKIYEEAETPQIYYLHND